MAAQAEGTPQPSPGAPQYLEQAMAWSDEVRDHARVALDLPYGGDERQKLDIYMPDAETAAPAPVLLFMHGGYWVIGHKDLIGFMAPALTPAPARRVAGGYRLAPGAKHPAQADDCRAALNWVYRNISGYGGDPERIYVGGHSAGGHLAAMLALQREQRNALGLPADVIKGCFPVSGVFDVTDTPPDRRGAFLQSDDDARGASPVYSAEGNTVPFLLEIGSDDFDNLRSQHPRMLAALRSQPGYAEEMVREGHAWVYRRYAVEDWLPDEAAARDSGLGLWSAGVDAPVPPWEWRRGKRAAKVVALGTSSTAANAMP